jgi:hypothetical protein
MMARSQQRMVCTVATDLYERDFVAWTKEQAAELRRMRDARVNSRLDLEQLAEEVEDLGSEQRFAVRSCTMRAIEHLLKLEFASASEPRALWKRSLRNARRSAARRLTPTLRLDVEEQLPKLFEEARDEVVFALEHYQEWPALDRLPDANPFSLDEILDADFWPPEPQARP